MAIKAYAYLNWDNCEPSDTPGNLRVRLAISAMDPSLERAYNVEAGEYPISDAPAVTNLAIANFVLAYAAAEMGVTVETGDTAVLLVGLGLQASTPSL
jgi:hypothetical protein